MEAILSAVKDNLLDENEEFTSELNAVVGEVGVHPQPVGFSCDICDKVCKTLRGLTRHRNSKYSTANNVEGDSYQGRFEKFEAEERLHPIYLKYIYREREGSAVKLSVDECYSQQK